jgi:hypothetical protein
MMLVCRGPRSYVTDAEDRQLVGLIGIYGDSAWDIIVGAILGRTKRQCKERCTHYLAPDIITCAWTSEEDERLLAEVVRHGRRWKQLEPLFPGRKDHQLKNRFAVLARRSRKARVRAPGFSSRAFEEGELLAFDPDDGYLSAQDLCE